MIIKRTFALGLLLSMLMLPFTSYAEDKTEPESTNTSNTSSYDWTVEVRNLLQSFHVSSPRFENTESDVKKMIRSLNDPYTAYFTNPESAKFIDLVNGDANALGIELETGEDGKLYISRVEPGSPADLRGLTEGDAVEAVNERTGSAEQLRKQLDPSGKEAGDDVKLTIKRGSDEKTVSLEYGHIHFSPVRSSMNEDGVGYIRLMAFTADADKAFSEALNQLESQGMTTLVLDLRDNGGGYMDTAKQIAAHFLEGGLLTKTISRTGEWETKIEGGRIAPYPLICLVNERSASASEVLAGALQDRKAAAIVGTHTYGKGVVQEMFRLLSGKGYLKITTKEYVTPNGNKVNTVGIQPDVRADGGVETLLRGLKLAGAKQMIFTADKGIETVNGIASSRQTPVIRKDGALFIPARLLAGLIDASVTWQGATSSVLIQKNGVSKTFVPSASDHEMLLCDGTSYIHVETFRLMFPALLVEEDETGKLTLKANL